MMGFPHEVWSAVDLGIVEQMSPLENVRIATRALGVNKLRSALTALGIVVGVAAVVCMVSVGAGAQAEVSEKIRTLGANLLLVMPGARNWRSQTRSRIRTYTDRRRCSGDPARAFRRAGRRSAAVTLYAARSRKPKLDNAGRGNK